MDATNGDILPPELLIDIFSYLSQKELRKKVNKVCIYWNELCLTPSLWTDICVSEEVYENTLEEEVEHILMIQDYVLKLYINPNLLCRLFCKYKTLKFINLKKLQIYGSFKNFDDLIGTLKIKCPNISDIALSIDKQIDVGKRLASLSRFHLSEITFFFECDCWLDADEHYINLFISKQHHLQKVSILHDRCSNRDESSTIAKLLDKCQSLTFLYIHNNQNYTGLAFTKSMQPLELSELIIDSARINDFALQCITERAIRLRILGIRNCPLITGSGLRYVENCHLLEKFSFGNYAHTSDTLVRETNCGFMYIAEGCKQLKDFQSLGWRDLNDDTIMTLAQSCVHLSIICIRRCSLTDLSLITIGKHFPNMKILTFEKCAISITGILSIISSCKHLDSLSLVECPGISDTELDDMHSENAMGNENASLEHGSPLFTIRDTCALCGAGNQNQLCKCYHSHLKKLYLQMCPNISMKTLLKLTSLCPDLLNLNISGPCIRPTEDFIHELATTCTLLRGAIIDNKYFKKLHHKVCTLYLVK